MAPMSSADENSPGQNAPHRRRPRYAGTHPRRFSERYKERDAQTYPEMQAHLRERGRTPAGTHVPIMLAEVLHGLAPRPGEKVADVTLGYGGHGEAFLRAIGPTGRLVGLDVDGEQLESTGRRLAGLGGTVSLHRSNYAGLAKVLAAEGIDGFDVVFADLGVSSMQLDDPERGFSYKHDGPLDMRMDHRLPRTAADVLAKMSSQELAAALAELADEEDAEAVAEAIVRRGKTARLTRTLELAEVVLAAKRMTLPEYRRRKAENPATLHPAARTFQALRMLVNDELAGLRQLLRVLPGCLRGGGRAGVLTFHSGEDRLVKRAFSDGLRDGTYAMISEEVMRPSAAEVAANPRSRPAKFRWARKAETLP